MKQLAFLVALIGLIGAGVTGCGGHKGGAIDIPEDNPYQISPEEQAAMNNAINKNTEALAEETTGEAIK